MSFVTPIKIENRICYSEAPIVKKYLQELSNIPLYLQEILANQDAKIVFFVGPLIDEPELGYDTVEEWDGLYGVYKNKKIFVRLDGTESIFMKKKRSLIIHETGHCIDELIGLYLDSSGYDSIGSFSKKLSSNTKFHKIFNRNHNYWKLSDKEQDEIRSQYFAQKIEEYMLSRCLKEKIKFWYENMDTFSFFRDFLKQAEVKHQKEKVTNNNI